MCHSNSRIRPDLIHHQGVREGGHVVKFVPSTDQLSVQTFPVRFTRIQKGAFAPLMATLACTVGLLFTKLAANIYCVEAVGINIEAQVIVGIGLNDDALVLTPSSGKRIELHCHLKIRVGCCLQNPDGLVST